MFVREKKNRSGSISVVVVSKQSGRYREVHTLGVSSDPASIKRLRQQALLWIKEKAGSPDIFARYEEERFEQESLDYFFNHIDNILLNGVLLILNQVFKLIGFDRIEDPIFRQLVISRISQPSSKVAMVIEPVEIR